jgi:RNA polymerase sigma-70 factor, ECF subfamily
MYRTHTGAERGFVHRRVSATAGNEAVADVFAIAWRRIDEAPSDDLSWLLGIA